LVIQTNKAKTNPIKAKTKPITERVKIDAKSVFTTDYDDKTVLWLCENKANQTQLVAA